MRKTLIVKGKPKIFIRSHKEMVSAATIKLFGIVDFGGELSPRQLRLKTKLENLLKKHSQAYIPESAKILLEDRGR